MSKITNLIGTTWRLDGVFNGLSSGYGIFNIDANGIYTIFANEEVLQEVTINTTLIACGYTVNDNLAPLDNECYIYATVGVESDYLPIQSDSTFRNQYEFTITGGTDIANPLFIDFINTYGTLVSGGEPPTAEGVKSKLQSLITASNAKTGKSDANLTDAVNTLLEGYKQGEDSPLPIEVATADEMTALLETAEVGAIYKYTGETTDTYENGALYVVEEESSSKVYTRLGDYVPSFDGTITVE